MLFEPCKIAIAPPDPDLVTGPDLEKRAFVGVAP